MPPPPHRCLPVLLATWLCLWLPGGHAQGLRSPSEYIAGFVRYVQWQGADRIAAWTVCIAGEQPEGEAAAYAGRQAQGKPFVVRRLVDGESPMGCHVLDLTQENGISSAHWLSVVRRMPILTVGTGAVFCSAGGHICLRPDGNDRGFDINFSSLHDAGLGVSARLLKLVKAGFAPSPTGTPPPEAE